MQEERNKHLVLEEIVESDNNAIGFMESIIEQSGIPTREVVQTYMIWIFKNEFGKEIREDPGWERSAQEYVNRKYAARFREVYDKRLHLYTIRDRLYGQPVTINPL